VDDFTIATPDGDRLLAKLAASHEFATARTQVAGELIATLPTLLSGADRPVPFDLAARWDATLIGSNVRVTALDLAARENPSAPPAISLVLRQPFEMSAGKAQRADPTVDLLTFSANDLSLAWLSRWLPDYTLAGRWAAGQSALRHAPDGEGFVFTTREPWRFSGLGIDIGGKNFFHGRAALAPEFSLRTGLVTARLRGLDLAEDTGNRLGGEATFEWRSAEKKFATTLALDATLPALLHSAGTFGALTATLRAQASSMEQKVSQLESFRLEVRNAAGPLVTIDTPEPLLFATKANGETIFSSVAPLSVALASVPLAWLRPWLPADTTIAGTLEPMQLLLIATSQRFHLRATRPVQVRDFSFARRGVPDVQGATGTFYPGLDLALFHQLRPKFEIAYTGRVHANAGNLEVAGATAVEFEAALGFIGNDKTVLPASGDLQGRVDFSALHRVPVLAENGMPAKGELVLRFNGDLLGREDAPEFWAQLSGVPAADGTRVLPTLEIGARGEVNGDRRSAGFDVAARLATTPLASDAAFRLNAANGDKTLTFDSVFRSEFFDIGELLALANAFKPQNAKPTASSSTALSPASRLPPPVSSPLGVPFWSALRGRFGLELGEVLFKPYRIAGVRGQVEATDRALVVSDLAGEMFAGRWSGGLRVDYDPQGAGGDHALSGRFRIDQFETARAIQTV
ncbi:MAG: hypothetical protein ABIR80_01555, partial [Opitutaceae bacterium]